MSRAGADAGGALVTMAAGLFFFWQAAALPDPGVDVLGPGAFPAALGGLLVALGGALLLVALLGRGGRAAGAAEEPEPVRWRLLGGVLALLVAYVVVIEWLGYLLATALYASATLAVLGGRGAGRLLAAGAAVAVVMTLLFGRLLGIDLPAGRFLGG